MAGSYSQDLRDRVIDAVEREGMSRRAAAQRFGVSESAAVKWLQRYEDKALKSRRIALAKRRLRSGRDYIWMCRPMRKILNELPLTESAGLVSRTLQRRRKGIVARILVAWPRLGLLWTRGTGRA